MSKTIHILASTSSTCCGPLADASVWNVAVTGTWPEPLEPAWGRGHTFVSHTHTHTVHPDQTQGVLMSQNCYTALPPKAASLSEMHLLPTTYPIYFIFFDFPYIYCYMNTICITVSADYHCSISYLATKVLQIGVIITYSYCHIIFLFIHTARWDVHTSQWWNGPIPCDHNDSCDCNQTIVWWMHTPRILEIEQK